MNLKDILQNKIEIDTDLNEVAMPISLDRQEYLELKKFFNLFGGEYNKKSKKFDFNMNPKPIIYNFINNGIVPEKNPTSFYPTPSTLVDEMFKMSDFDSFIFSEEIQSKFSCLEPSGGVGGIAKKIREIAPYIKLDVVEILRENQLVLKDEGFNPICQDFLEYNKDYSKKYDLIFMNPPFNKNEYIKHIEHAFNMLSSIGKLTAIVPVSFLKNSDKLSKWLYETVTLYGDVEINQENYFKEQKVNIKTCIIHIDKRNEKSLYRPVSCCKNFHVYKVWLSLYSCSKFNNFITNLKYSKDMKEKIITYIKEELDHLKNQNIFYPYSYLDDYADKAFIEWCYEHNKEDLIKEFVFEDKQKQMFLNMAVKILLDIQFIKTEKDLLLLTKQYFHKNNIIYYLNKNVIYDNFNIEVIDDKCWSIDNNYKLQKYNIFSYTLDDEELTIKQYYYNEDTPYNIVKDSLVNVSKKELEKMLLDSDSSIENFASSLEAFYIKNNHLIKNINVINKSAQKENKNSPSLPYGDEEYEAFSKGCLF